MLWTGDGARAGYSSEIWLGGEDSDTRTCQVWYQRYDRKVFDRTHRAICASLRMVPARLPPTAPRTDIPTDPWVRIYFRSINARSDAAGLRRLRDEPVAAGDIEVRVWEGFGLSPLQGTILRRKGNVWSAVRLMPVSGRQPSPADTRPLREPIPRWKDQTGWGEFWNDLRREGLLTLPDASTLKPDGVNALDGICYVVEFKDDRLYRTYMYDNPESHPKRENSDAVKQMIWLIHDRLWNHADHSRE